MISDDLQLLREIIDNDAVFFELCKDLKKTTIIFIKDFEAFIVDERSCAFRLHLPFEKIKSVHECFRGMLVYFPDSINREQENLEIYKDYMNGYTYRQLLRKYDRTMDNVRKICAKYKSIEPDNLTKQREETLNKLEFCLNELNNK